MKALPTVKKAVAAVFIEQKLSIVRTRPSRVLASEITEQCRQWCDVQRLPFPGVHCLAEGLRKSGAVRQRSNGKTYWRNVDWRGLDSLPKGFEFSADRDALRHLSTIEPLIPLKVFCHLARISDATFYRLIRRGTGPEVCKRGNQNFIKAVTAAEWCMENGKYLAVVELGEWVRNNADNTISQFGNLIRVCARRYDPGNIGRRTNPNLPSMVDFPP